MKYFIEATLVLLLVLSIVNSSQALTFSNALGNDMVLQRSPSQARIWGTCAGVVNCEVQVTFLGENYQSTVNANNYWEVYLPAMPAGGPYNITATDTQNNQIYLLNVLFGDVFVCSGQSNMEMTVIQTINATDNIERSSLYRNIRLFTVGQGTTSNTPLFEFNTIEQRWVAPSPQTVGGPDYSVFSGVCWYFGIYLYTSLQVPIGLISSNWGGTSIQQWSSPTVLANCGTGTNSVLWNAMIYPLLPMSISGALWYQGESNVGNPDLYACLFPGMISDWRNNWKNSNNENFGFYYVMLAAYLVSPGDVALPQLRESQLSADSLPKVGMGSAVDLGDLNSPYGDIHPRDKETVGARLQLQALKLAYNEQVQADGPLVQSVVNNPTVPVEDGLFEVSCTISFFADTVGNFLKKVDNVCPEGISGYCGWYDVQIDDGQGWKVVLDGGTIGSDAVTVIVSLRANYAATIIGLRYGFADWPVCTLYNDADLPATPFSVAVPFQAP